MSASNKPTGKTVCPLVSIRCARALSRYLRYAIKQDEEDLLAGVNRNNLSQDMEIVESFLTNLNKEIKWREQDLRHAAEHRRAELKKLILDQAADIALGDHVNNDAGE